MSFNVAGSSAEWQQQCHHCRGAGASLPRERQFLALRDLPCSQDWGKKKPHRLKPPPLISFECPREQKDLPCLQRKMVLVAAPGGSDGGTGVFIPPDCHCPPSWELCPRLGTEGQQEGLGIKHSPRERPEQQGSAPHTLLAAVRGAPEPCRRVQAALAPLPAQICPCADQPQV